jgi:hypothetical protein
MAAIAQLPHQRKEDVLGIVEYQTQRWIANATSDGPLIPSKTRPNRLAVFRIR